MHIVVIAMASILVSRNVIKKVLAIERAEGVGARVRRSIGTRELRNLSPFLMLDHFRVDEGAGFPDHPHRGMVTGMFISQCHSLFLRCKLSYIYASGLFSA